MPVFYQSKLQKKQPEGLRGGMWHPEHLWGWGGAEPPKAACPWLPKPSPRTTPRASGLLESRHQHLLWFGTSICSTAFTGSVTWLESEVKPKAALLPAEDGDL